MRRWFSLLVATECVTLLTLCTGCHWSVARPGCNSSPRIAHEWPSPDGKTKAVENRFDCPGWYAMTIDIVGADNQTKTTAFNDRPVAQARPAVWPDLKVEWKSDRELWVTYPA